MHLGSKELHQKFERQKKEILRWSEEAIVNLSEEASAKASELSTKLEELQIQAALGKAETTDALKDQEKKLTALLREVSAKSQELSQDASIKFKDFKNDGAELLEKWQTSFDMLKLQVLLGTADARDEWEEKKAEFNASIDKFEDRLSKMRNDGKKDFSNFKKEMSAAWEHVKRGISKGK